MEVFKEARNFIVEMFIKNAITPSSKKTSTRTKLSKNANPGKEKQSYSFKCLYHFQF